MTRRDPSDQRAVCLRLDQTTRRGARAHSVAFRTITAIIVGPRRLALARRRTLRQVPAPICTWRTETLTCDQRCSLTSPGSRPAPCAERSAQQRCTPSTSMARGTAPLGRRGGARALRGREPAEGAALNAGVPEPRVGSWHQRFPERASELSALPKAMAIKWGARSARRSRNAARPGGWAIHARALTWRAGRRPTADVPPRQGGSGGGLRRRGFC